jgi:hypothetical protein
MCQTEQSSYPIQNERASCLDQTNLGCWLLQMGKQSVKCNKTKLPVSPEQWIANKVKDLDANKHFVCAWLLHLSDDS